MKSLIVLLLLSTGTVCAQSSPFFQNLPAGPYWVGFRIVTLTDSARVTRPLYNYLGEKDTGDRHRKITLHLWYPARSIGEKAPLTYGQYCLAEKLSRTDEKLPTEIQSALLTSRRQNFEAFFGQITDADWQRLAQTPLLARPDAAPLKGKFPMLAGMLRAVSTSVTNEWLASHGYVVAMVTDNDASYPNPQTGYIQEVQDMQKAMAYLIRSGQADEERIGTFGFSGSGLTQVLLAMHDSRIGALADLESAIYGEGIWDWLAQSDYYLPQNLHVPFLHIYGKKLASADTHFDEFHKKIYSDRYHLLLNNHVLHHWDVATEGRASTTVLHVRGEQEPAIQASFELAHGFLLHFFNAVLTGEKASQQMLTSPKAFSQYPDSLWTLTHYPAQKPPPDVSQFTEIIRKRGIDTALVIARHYLATDSLAAFVHENALNRLAHELLEAGQPYEGLRLMRFAAEAHPQQAWLWNNLASMHEDLGHPAEARKCSEKVLALTAPTPDSDMSFNARVRRSASDRIQRLTHSTR